MLIRRVCPDCHKLWAVVEGTFMDKPGTAELTICCPECYGARRCRIAELDSKYPSAESLGLLGSMTEPPASRTVRPHSSGRRVVRKSEPMAG